jgi:hypothetical protein
MSDYALAGLTGSVGTVADALDDALAGTTIGLVQDRVGTRVIGCPPG